MLIDTSKVERLEHPSEQGAWIEIRPVLAVELDEARTKQMQRSISLWGDSMDALQKAATSTTTKPSATDDLQQRIVQFDPEVLLNAAVVKWSEPVEVNPDNIRKLDAITREWLIEEVVKRNTRPLRK